MHASAGLRLTRSMPSAGASRRSVYRKRSFATFWSGNQTPSHMMASSHQVVCISRRYGGLVRSSTSAVQRSVFGIDARASSTGRGVGCARVRPHRAGLWLQGVLKALNVNKLTKSGVTFKFWCAAHALTHVQLHHGDQAQILCTEQVVRFPALALSRVRASGDYRVQSLHHSQDVTAHGIQQSRRVTDLASREGPICRAAC